MTSTHVTYALHIVDRRLTAPKMQAVLTQYGSNIRTRFGTHDPICGAGVIILQMMGPKENYANMEKDLQGIGVEVKMVEFECQGCKSEV